MPDVSAGGGRGPSGTMEVPTLTVVCREGLPPAHDIFLHDGCGPQPVPSRPPFPGPGPAEEARAAAFAGSAARRRDRGGDRGIEVVRRDRAVGRRCRGRRAGRARGCPRPGGGVHVPAEESTFRRAFAMVSADVLDEVLGAWLHTRPMQVCDLPGGQIPGQNGKRAPRHGLAAQPGHQHPAPGRPHKHRRRQPPPRPRPVADAKATSDCISDFAVSLSYPSPYAVRLPAVAVQDVTPWPDTSESSVMSPL